MSDLGLSAATVADARARFASQFFSGDENNPAFLSKINEVVERFHSRERWVGSLATFRIDVSTDKNIYLPYYLDSINAAVLDENPAMMFGERYEFMHNGPGLVTVESGMPGVIVDAGVFGISVDYPALASTITVSAVAAGDVGITIRILGYDDDGKWVRDTTGAPGEEVTLAGTLVTTATSFSAVKAIQKPLTRGPITITHGDSATVLAELENWMTNPRFRCYRVLDISTQDVVALCKRRPIPVHYEEDYIYPGDLSALKLGMYGLQYEEASEPAKMQQYFREAIELLNEGSASYKGGAQEQMSYEPWGPGVSGIDSTH